MFLNNESFFERGPSSPTTVPLNRFLPKNHTAVRSDSIVNNARPAESSRSGERGSASSIFSFFFLDLKTDRDRFHDYATYTWFFFSIKRFAESDTNVSEFRKCGVRTNEITALVARAAAVQLNLNVFVSK